ncbi:MULTISPECIES: hydrogenase nickel incorporation protein HypB [unclassified Brenneria]|uniref:hydrogenase nickel incorporation protein HypB n=1 Tax=unclassified Brenneria TaxID=2634434 RepID=UPI0029C43076|nr:MULTISPECIES: hydrogenase nickel incorporation protein HypB [unclassified Brenneria]MDX5629202.1 hydrogenase nickel incorporation protein HypB [Brenneria sp. L3-3Z]MDX5696341.1 hydrogenase nickel incorporation protein HypB [Brenneria sp. L4-2C]MEE3662792.1 hydrogenase nickel incorporation protein HypB [Brenneria sp. g21c3]
MCTTCGCGEGESRIEGEEHLHQHDHHHEHEHGHKHDHHHDHEHDHHDHGHHHGGKIKGRCVIIHHHHYHGDVHNHYYALPPKIRQGAKPAKQHAADEREAAFQPEVNEQDLHYGHGEAGTHAPGVGQQRLLQIEMDVLSKNNHLAEHNREHFNAQNILALNLVSSPGSGKTTLLTATLNHISQKVPCAVIEGDQQTTNDAERIRATGVAAIQVNTGKGCHLDAQMVHDAAHRLQLPDNSLLFIENVGNLVCPAGFDLGERAKVAVLSVTEGEDKPLKYPHMFAAASLMVINKIDLLPYLDFNLEACVANARRVNPDIQVIALSASHGDGMEEWIGWLEAQLCA